MSAVAERTRRSTPDTATRLLVADLLLDLDEMNRLLQQQVSRGDWLNGFLLAAGMAQTVEDWLDRDFLALSKVAKHATAIRAPLGPGLAFALRLGSRLEWRWRRWTPGWRRCNAWLQRLRRLVMMLADSAFESGATATTGRQAAALGAGLRRLPRRARDEVVRLPSCFRSFDQRPADVRRIGAGFARRWPDRERPILIVGVRTSGSYLAPLYAASLAGIGYSDLNWITVRPGRPWRREQVQAAQGVVAGGGLVLLCDDPPDSGSALAAVAAALEGLGFAPAQVVLGLQVFDHEPTLPEPLRRYQAVVLPWHDWDVHQAMRPEAVKSALTTLMLPLGMLPLSVRASGLPLRRPGRGHLEACFEVTVLDQGQSRSLPVHASGVGLGYLGDHALAVAAVLGDAAPTIYGIESGVLFRERLPEAARPGAFGVDHASAVARYVAARAGALAAASDKSLRLSGRDPVWQRASDLCSRCYGRFAPFARAPLHRAAKRLLAAKRPSVIDGRMGPGNWFQVGDRLKKIAFDDRAFSNQDMYCYDALFDLASASAPFAQTDFTSELLLAWTRCGQDRPDAERWLLYRLLSLEDEKRGGRRPLVEIEHDLERVHQEYVAGVYFGDLSPAAGGAAVAIDIDGVLETGWLGFSTITPAGAMSLRALLAHGFRPVLASGRSFAGVRDRCRLYGLAGAVAEYGAVAYDREQDASIELLAAAQLELLEQLRERLRGMPGVELDATYTRSVRAFVVAGGRRRRLDPERTRVALRGLETELRAVEGVAQTDFVPAVIDKAVGLRALLGDRPLELAVGDTSSDLPMLQMARVGRAPANADRAVHAAGVQVSSQPYQRGLAAAVSELIGHRPGACPVCRRRALDGRASILELALSAQDRGRWGKAALTLLLALRVAR